jgi:hypothetical protein
LHGSNTSSNAVITRLGNIFNQRYRNAMSGIIYKSLGRGWL